MAADSPFNRSRREALRCLAFGGAGTLFALSAGVLVPMDLASAAARKGAMASDMKPLFVQISDTHIGFSKEANPDAPGTLLQSIAQVNAMPVAPSFIMHTGDITHLSKPEEFDKASQLLSGLKVSELHTVPGEHDVGDAAVTEYFDRFGKASNRKGYYSFDHSGVHFIALVNVLNFKPGGLGALGDEQLKWLQADLKARSSSTPIVVFAHMPMWTIYEPWGWGTADSEQALSYLRGFGSVTILNGHIHQIVTKTEGNMVFHTARSTAFPQATAGVGPGPGPLKVPTEDLRKMLGITSVRLAPHPSAAVLTDTTLAEGGLMPVASTAAAAMPMVRATTNNNTVLIKDFDFGPMQLSVPAGTTVAWKNLDGEPHTIVSAEGLFRSNALDQDDTFTYRFDKPGTYRYVCSLHPRMVGTVVVTG
jgi:plastocyanin